jgi:hypothetical protein
LPMKGLWRVHGAHQWVWNRRNAMHGGVRAAHGVFSARYGYKRAV